MRAFIHTSPGAALPAVVLFLTLLALAGCGSSASGTARGSSAFQLHVLPSSFDLGGSAQFDLKVLHQGGTVKVDVTASDARALKAAYIDLGYDAGSLTPLGAQSTGLLARGSGRQLVELALTGEPGTLHHGQVLAQPQTAAGFTGSGVVARFTFGRQPMPRSVSSAPRNQFSQTQLSWASPGVLAWRFASAGDYDQNGEVNISDLTPLAKQLGHAVAPAQFAFDSLDSVCDGDRNGEVNVADITPIGANWRVSTRKYLVYSSMNEIDYPDSPLDPEKVGPIAEVAIGDTQDSAGQKRVSYSYIADSPAEGAYYWVRPADESGSPGTASNSVQFFTPNQSPAASIVPDQSSGTVPFTVNFNCSGSTDPDGNIVKYEYDWDGSGTAFGWEDMGLQNFPSHTFDTGGSFTVTVRVTDNDGATSTAQTVINAVVQEEPTAALAADPTDGSAPLTVNFNASGSTDNGSIVKYEWDFDGDGIFESDSGAVPVAAHDYNSAGIYDAAVRVTDNEGLTDTADVPIAVTPGLGAPTAVIKATPTSSTAPFSVTFDGSQSSDDGSIVNYEWDFDGDGIYDQSGPADSTTFSYDFPGLYNATLRVTDTDSQTATDSVQITALKPGGSGPVAVLLANPRYGPIPLQVSFDASHSFSPDGAITLYEWDWDGDGTYDSSGTDPTVQHTFAASGAFDTTLRITDAVSGQAQKIMLVLATSDDTFPPNDSVFALPTQNVVKAGDAVGIEIFCKGSVNPLQYVGGLRMTMPAGNTYVANSFNAGAVGGAGADSIDGLWAQMMPSGLLLPPDSFILITDIGGGQEAIDLNVTPLSGSDLTLATGAICNFELNINSDSYFGFQRTNGVSRTYYLDQNQVPEYFWANENVTGLPAVYVQ